MKTVTHVRKPATLINIAYFTTVLIGALVTTLAYTINEADAKTLTEVHIEVCERTHYGVTYSETRNSKCKLIWEYMSYQVLNTIE